MDRKRARERKKGTRSPHEKQDSTVVQFYSIVWFPVGIVILTTLLQLVGRVGLLRRIEERERERMELSFSLLGLRSDLRPCQIHT